MNLNGLYATKRGERLLAVLRFGESATWRRGAAVATGEEVYAVPEQLSDVG